MENRRAPFRSTIERNGLRGFSTIGRTSWKNNNEVRAHPSAKQPNSLESLMKFSPK